MADSNLGIDLGGTKIMGLVVGADNKVLAREKVKTKPSHGFEEVCDQIRSLANKVLESAGVPWSEIKEIGIAVPTSIDPETGEGLHAPNLAWKNRPLRATLTKLFEREIYLENDANCGILGEFRIGAGAGRRSVVGYFVGTGLGGGIIVDGKLLRGKRGAAAELGHEIVRAGGRKCGCGKEGCIEAYCSKTAFGKQFDKKITQKGCKSVLTQLVGDDFSRLKSTVLSKAFKSGDKVTVEVVSKGFAMLGIAASNMASVLAPEAIIFGGGVIEEFRDEAMPIIRTYLRSILQISNLSSQSSEMTRLPWEPRYLPGKKGKSEITSR